MKLKISTTLHKQLQDLDREKLKDLYTFETNEAGFTIATKEKRLIHSKYSIENEAKNAFKDIDKNTKAIIFYGFGLSYIVKYFIENIKNYGHSLDNIIIIIIVNDYYLFDYFCNNIDTTLFENNNIFFVSDSDDTSFIFSILKNNNTLNFKFITLQSLNNKEKEIALIYKKELFKYTQINVADMLTRMNFENLWLKNILFNSLYLEYSADISVLKNSANGFNALLVCAGPTLQESIEDIKKQRESFIIIAVDTAYSILSKSGIDVDFVITADGGFFNAFDFIYEGSNFNYLVMDLISNKKIPDIVKDKANMLTFSSTKSFPVIQEIEKKMGITISELFLGSTIATAMIDFAYFMGFNKALIIGLDNSYPYYYRHSKHTLSYEYHINKTTKLDTIESYYFDSIKNYSDMAVYPPTSYVLSNQIDYLSDISNKYKDMEIMRLKGSAIDIEIINSGNINDIAIKGSRIKALDNFKRLYKKNIIDKEIIKNYYSTTIKYLLDFNAKLYEIYNELSKNEENYSELENKTFATIEEYSKKIVLIENILNTVITISKLKNLNIMFIITEAIKTTNYFTTRLNIVLEKSEDE